MNRSAVGFSVGLGNWNRGRRQTHLAKGLAMSAPHFLHTLETGAVFQSGISQQRIKLRGRFALRAPGPYFIQAELFLGATNEIGNFHAHVAGSVQRPGRAFVAAVEIWVRAVDLEGSAAAGGRGGNELQSARFRGRKNERFRKRY